MENAHEVITEALSGSTVHSEAEIKKAATYLYNNQPPHHCYWNNRFYLAIKFDLPEKMKRESARRAVRNGKSGYWEWRTHSGYDMVQGLRDIGINNCVPESLEDVPEHLYIPVDSTVMREIEKKFNL